MKMNKEQVNDVIEMFHEVCTTTWHESPVPLEQSFTRGVWEREISSRGQYPGKAWADAMGLMVAGATANSKCPKLGDLLEAVEGLLENDDYSSADKATLKKHLHSRYARSDEAKAAAYEQIKQQKLKDLGVI